MKTKPSALSDRPDDHALAVRLRTARGTRSRTPVVNMAVAVPGAPDLTDRHLEDLEKRGTQLPGRLFHLMYFAEALGISPFDYLQDLGLWPPPGDPRKHAEELISQACKLAGWTAVRAEGGIVVRKAA